MTKTGGKNSWALFLLILAGVVLGGFIGYLAKNISFLSWLDFGQIFGLDKPVVINLGIIVITFGLKIKITMAGVIGVIAAIFVYRKL